MAKRKKLNPPTKDGNRLFENLKVLEVYKLNDMSCIPSTQKKYIFKYFKEYIY